MITDHVFRPDCLKPVGDPKRDQCPYMTCRRPRAEHARAVSGRFAR